jgi:predicted membrane protein (TIGR00267 family)
MILKLQKPAVAQAVYSALAMGLSYIVGGILPMIPYFIAADVTTALFASIGITVGVLLVFGFVKTRMNVGSVRLAVVGALQTLLVGVVAAGASYGIVRAVDSRGQTR